MCSDSCVLVPPVCSQYDLYLGETNRISLGRGLGKTCCRHCRITTLETHTVWKPSTDTLKSGRSLWTCLKRTTLLFQYIMTPRPSCKPEITHFPWHGSLLNYSVYQNVISNTYTHSSSMSAMKTSVLSFCALHTFIRDCVWCHCSVCIVPSCERYSHTGKTGPSGPRWRSVYRRGSRPRWSGCPRETDSSWCVTPPSTTQKPGKRNMNQTTHTEHISYRVKLFPLFSLQVAMGLGWMQWECSILYLRVVVQIESRKV